MTREVADERTLERAEPAPRLKLEHVSKTFGSNAVLRDVGITVKPGEIHALLGQNGSGKSTLIKVLSGLYRPDSGAVIQVDGRELSQPINPARISDHGLTIIHQSLGLIPGHSVTENIRMGKLSRRRLGLFIDWKYERERAASTLRDMNSSIDPDRIVDTLLAGQRATVAIARALQVVVAGSGCVVLDESTQSLSREVLPEFYETLRALSSQGTSIVLVSHRLEEVLSLADRVTILRDGAVTAAGVSTHEMTEEELSQRILGRELIAFSRETGTRSHVGVESAAPVRIRGLTGRVLRDFDIDVEPGEIVGLTGPTDSGWEELPYLVCGAMGGADGTLEIHGRSFELSRMSVRDSLDAGVVMVPADRGADGLALEMGSMSNVTLPRVEKRARAGLLTQSWQRDEFSAAVDLLHITPPDPEQLVTSFSGGNQQKLLLAKWLLHNPRFLVLHEPTQAVDVGARADILKAIVDAAASGAAVVLASIESQDLRLVCDRIIVLDQGKVDQELHGPFGPARALEPLDSPVPTTERFTQS